MSYNIQVIRKVPGITSTLMITDREVPFGSLVEVSSLHPDIMPQWASSKAVGLADQHCTSFCLAL